MYNLLLQSVLMFPVYVLFIKRIEALWFRDFSNTHGIRTYCFNYFQVYILIHLHQHQKRKKFKLFTKILELYQVSQRFRYSQIVYIKSNT